MESLSAEFEASGYALLPRLLDPATVIGLMRESDRVLSLARSEPAGGPSGPRLHNILSARPGDASAVDGRLSLHVEHVFRFSPIFHELIHDRRMTGPVRAVCDPDLRLLDDQLYWKPAATGGATYVHRDSDFFGPLRVVTAWLPLCDVDEANGCLWVIPGSHHPDAPVPGLRRRTAPPPGTPDDRRPFDFFYEVDGGAGFRPVPMAAGDVLLIHRHLVHCSREVRSDRGRLAYLVEYFAAGDFARYRTPCAGLFDYHDRWRYVELIPPTRPS
jgi:hypothetical protein